MHLEYNDVKDPIQYCEDIILREAKEEDRLVSLILYTIFSASTTNPINLAINAPSGEGKSHVVLKVAEVFPQNELIFFEGMTDKALFHRRGILVIKNEKHEYVPIEDKLEDIDTEIEEKECEIASSHDNNLKQARSNQINELKKQKKDLFKNAKKLIDLSNKVLIFLDTPSAKLFEVLMPLLSHDKYEAEYEFTDTHNGIKTKTNILRGFPAVIFTAAIDYSHTHRYSEIQRRFIIANPKMTSEKYSSAIHHIAHQLALPDFVYQKLIVSDAEKEKARSIIQQIQERLSEITKQNKPGQNSVLIPFYESIQGSLPNKEAIDMTIAKRFYTFMSFLPIINSEKRPRLVIRKYADPILNIIPLATFDDFKEALSLMKYSNGVRPYILEWFHEVFLAAFERKTSPDRKDDKEEKTIALTTEQLVEKTYEVQIKRLSPKQILENYLNPLVNTNYVVKADSDLDKRSNIYYPVISTRNRNLFDLSRSNNSPADFKIVLKDPRLYPDKQYIISKIQEILSYSSEEYAIIKLQNENGKEESIQEIVDRYYSNADDYFERPNNSLDNDKPKSDFDDSSQTKAHKLNQNDPFDEYLKEAEIASELQENPVQGMENKSSDEDINEKLFDRFKSNNFIYSCYYCCNYQTDITKEYESHVILKHRNKHAYPSKAELERLGISGKGMSWEI